MKRGRQKQRLASVFPILLVGILSWVVGEFLSERVMPGTSLKLLGRHVGVAADISPVGCIFRAGWSWPTETWQPGHSPGNLVVETGHECFGFLLGIRGRDFNGNPSASQRWYLIGIPWWFIGALAVAPRMERRARRRRAARIRRLKNRCTVCGYDLRATPHRCPECGAIPPGVVGRISSV